MIGASQGWGAVCVEAFAWKEDPPILPDYQTVLLCYWPDSRKVGIEDPIFLESPQFELIVKDPSQPMRFMGFEFVPAPDEDA